MLNYSNSLWFYRVTEEAYVAETTVWHITFLINMFTALKGSQFKFYLLDPILVVSNNQTETWVQAALTEG